MSLEIKSLILFNYSKPNTYSYAALMGSLDSYSTFSDNIEIKIINQDLFKFFKNEQNWKNYSNYKHIILLYSLFSEQFLGFSDKIFKIKKLFKEHIGKSPLIIAGGPHPSARPIEVLKAGVDIVIQGEGEYNFPRIINWIHQKGYLDESYDDYRGKGGIYYYYNSKLCSKESSERLNLDNYSSISFKHRLFGPVEISRGCPFCCKFCQYGNFYNNMKHKSIKTIFKTIKKAVEVKYDKIWFLSSNSFAYGSKSLNPNPMKVKELLSKLYKIGGLNEIYFGTFPSEVRPEFVTHEMLDSCIPYISNKYFIIGAQTASNRLLQYINRGHTFEDVLNAIDILKEYGFNCHLDFIFGLPSETSEDIDENINFFKYILKQNNIKIHSHTFMPLPGSKFENKPAGKVIPLRLQKILRQLISQGKAYGQYQTQLKVAQLIENL